LISSLHIIESKSKYHSRGFLFFLVSRVAPYFSAVGQGTLKDRRSRDADS
jgi:hypothetical protein